MKIIRLLIIIGVVYYGVTHLLTGSTAGPSGKFNEIGLTPLLEAAYNNPQALEKDLDTMDEIHRESRKEAANFFLNTMAPRLQSAFFASVTAAPDNAVTDYFSALYDMMSTLQSAPEGTCTTLMSIRSGIPTLNQAMGMGEYLEQVMNYQRDVYRAQADMINGARSNPDPLRVSQAAAVKMYTDRFLQHFRSRNQMQLLEKLSTRTITEAETCKFYLLSYEAIITAPAQIRPTIMKGSLLAAMQ